MKRLTQALVLVGLVSWIGGTSTQAIVPPLGATAACTNGDYFNDMVAYPWQISFYAETIADGSNCEAEVEGWIVGDPAGAIQDQQLGFAAVNPQMNGGDYCGMWDGRSNHWMIDGGGWHEIYSWALSQDWAGSCGI